MNKYTLTKKGEIMGALVAFMFVLFFAIEVLGFFWQDRKLQIVGLGGAICTGLLIRLILKTCRVNVDVK